MPRDDHWHTALIGGSVLHWRASLHAALQCGEVAARVHGHMRLMPRRKTNDGRGGSRIAAAPLSVPGVTESGSRREEAMSVDLSGADCGVWPESVVRRYHQLALCRILGSVGMVGGALCSQPSCWRGPRATRTRVGVLACCTVQCHNVGPLAIHCGSTGERARLQLSFHPPVHTFTVASREDLLALIVFLLVAVLTSHLAGGCGRRRISPPTAKADGGPVFLEPRDRWGRWAGGDPPAIVTHVAAIPPVRTWWCGSLTAAISSPRPDILRSTPHRRGQSAATWSGSTRQPLAWNRYTAEAGQGVCAPWHGSRRHWVLACTLDTPGQGMSLEHQRFLDALAAQFGSRY